MSTPNYITFSITATSTQIIHISTIYIIILSLIVVTSICIAGGLTYYFVAIGDASSDICPYPVDSPRRFVKSTSIDNTPDEGACPIDHTVFTQLMSVRKTTKNSEREAQNKRKSVCVSICVCVWRLSCC